VDEGLTFRLLPTPGASYSLLCHTCWQTRERKPDCPRKAPIHFGCSFRQTRTATRAGCSGGGVRPLDTANHPIALLQVAAGARQLGTAPPPSAVTVRASNAGAPLEKTSLSQSLGLRQWNVVNPKPAKPPVRCWWCWCATYLGGQLQHCLHSNPKKNGKRVCESPQTHQTPRNQL
jgi:hypothetical protein